MYVCVCVCVCARPCAYLTLDDSVEEESIADFHFFAAAAAFDCALLLPYALEEDVDKSLESWIGKFGAPIRLSSEETLDALIPELLRSGVFC